MGKVDDTSFSARSVPWMKLGTTIEAAIPAAEAMQRAELDFEVALKPVYYRVGDKMTKFPGRSVIARKDNGQAFGIASDDYQVIQYSEAFDFIDGIHPEIVAAGSLRKGRQAFMVCKAPGQTDLEVADGDEHDMYVVLRTSHDCSKAVEVFLLPLRGMCMNQLPLKTFGRNAKQSWSIRHVSTAKEKLLQAQSVITGIEGYAQEFRETAKKLAAIDIELAEAEDLLRAVLPDRPKRADAIDSITGLLLSSPTVGEQFHRTGWGLVNAVGEYFEHTRDVGTAESRFTNGLSGSTNKYVNRTAQLLVRR